MTESLFAQTVATATGLLMLTAVLQVWRRSTDASTKLLAIQGAALALLVGAIGLAEGHAELVLIAFVVLAFKAVALPGRWPAPSNAQASTARTPPPSTR